MNTVIFCVRAFLALIGLGACFYFLATDGEINEFVVGITGFMIRDVFSAWKPKQP